MYDYLKNYNGDTIARYTALYEKFQGMYHALLFAQDEGVFEITVRSQSGAVVIPVGFGDGTEIAAMMVENFSKRVDDIQHQLNYQITELGAEIEASQKREEKEVAEREDASKLAHQEYKAKEAASQLEIARQIIAEHEATQKGGATR